MGKSQVQCNDKEGEKLVRVMTPAQASFILCVGIIKWKRCYIPFDPDYRHFRLALNEFLQKVAVFPSITVKWFNFKGNTR